MYRLLKVGGASVRHCSPLPLRNIVDCQSVVRNCVFCNGSQPHSYAYTRKCSSSANSHLMSINKDKRKKNRKVFKSDILVVSEQSSKVKKASVQNLTAEDLSVLVNADLNLNELYKLRQASSPKLIGPPNTNTKLLEFSESLTEAPVIVTPRLDGINLDEFYSGSIKSVLERPAVEPIHKEVGVDPSTTAHSANAKMDEQKLVEAHHQLVNETTLSAFIEICNHLKNPNRGFRAFCNFHIVHKRHRLKSTKVYNLLLKGFALKGDYKKVKEVLKFMSDEGIAKDVRSYAAIFECLSRTHNTPQTLLTELGPYIDECLSQNITLNDIVTKVPLTSDQRKMVLEAIRCRQPSFQPRFPMPRLQYKNHLVDVLNHESQLKRLEPVAAGEADNGSIFTVEKMRKCVDQQVKMEAGVFVEVKSVETKEAPTKEVLANRATLDEHYKVWETSALAAFQRDLASLTAQKHFSVHLEPYLRCIPQRDFVNIVLEEAKKLGQGSETYSPTAAMLRNSMGYKVYMRYRTFMKMINGVMDKTINIHKSYCEHYVHNHGQLDHLPTEQVYLNPRQQWQWIEYGQRHTGSSLFIQSAPWAPTTIQEIGKFLFRIMMYDLKVDVNALRPNDTTKNHLPAFYTIFRTQNRIMQEEIKPHPILSRLYRASQPETLSFPAYELPMVCPPIPWISTEIGGYVVSPGHVVRMMPQAFLQKQLLRQCDPVQLYPNFDALNQLSAVPWKVNGKVLDIIIEVFRSGGSAKLDIPEHPSSLQPPSAPTEDMDKSEKYQLYIKKLQYRRKKGEMLGLWCDCLYRLSLANHYKDKVFWLPHNMDFRGRVYPIPPHLSHLGSDLARSILVFAEPRPLGPKGLDWLKIHLVNLTGLKKRDPLEERLKFANSIMDKILDSANNPMTGERWWAKSEEPWQTLACCMEIADAIRSGDTVNYRSNFPVHQDGSCNGLQHYAALGRDKAGAYSVNLTPADVPQDVYSAVVQLVEQQRAVDAANGVEIAKVLEGFVKRKVIKQTIMTTVYGVTRFGARLQIAKQLKDIDDFPADMVWAASLYLTGRTFDSLRTMFTSTKEIQDWFTECARQISSISMQHIEWVTPMGLPIVQPYFKYKKLPTRIRSAFESFPVDKYGLPNVMKQKNAFPPNFIHSLDSSHMMLTSLYSEREGITFVSVHDCYWTHPSTVAIMNKICREQFVALHSEPILENLSEFLYQRFSYNNADLVDDGSVMDLTKKKLNRKLLQLPKKGDFDIRQVLESVYFFS